MAFKNTACANKLCRLNCFPSVRSNRSMDICVLLMNSSRFYWRCDVLQAKYIIHVVYEICRCWEAVLPCTSNMHNENLEKVLQPLFFFFAHTVFSSLFNLNLFPSPAEFHRNLKLFYETYCLLLQQPNWNAAIIIVYLQCCRRIRPKWHNYSAYHLEQSLRLKYDLQN